MTFHKWFLFIYCVLLCFWRKYSCGFCRLFHGLEFGVWRCHLRLEESSLTCNLTHRWGGEKKKRIRDFPKVISAKVNAIDYPEIWTRLLDSIFRTNNLYTTRIQTFLIFTFRFLLSTCFLYSSVVFSTFVVIVFFDSFLFYAPYPFRTWVITPLHSFLSFVDLSEAFTIPPTPCSIYTNMLRRLLAVYVYPSWVVIDINSE